MWVNDKLYFSTKMKEAFGTIKLFWSLIEKECNFNVNEQNLKNFVAKIPTDSSYFKAEGRKLFDIVAAFIDKAKELYGGNTDKYLEYIFSHTDKQTKDLEFNKAKKIFEYYSKIYNSMSDFMKSYMGISLGNNLSSEQLAFYNREYLVDFLLFCKQFQKVVGYDLDKFPQDENIEDLAKLLKYCVDHNSQWL